MRAVVQRVLSAKVKVNGQEISAIGPGLLVFLGVKVGDTEEDAWYLAEKIAGLRVFPDREGKMNLSVQDTGGRVLVVSQFTLYGDCRKGRRPSFSEAAPAEEAEKLYQSFVEALKKQGLEVACGQFQAYMQVELVNDGPVTLLLDSNRLF
ncbi:D-tyrosyl-tRNA(Tyr) deacylase [Thermanaeromonas toyohensis ToBE]|uniref:D-aminoacyl-tRNA deacylase n=1 Tax=Thermanaeromonas toyohensis ToBE TaxID=698762 RepID=A0A1W1W172_9FIRM|nr:D-aminoacyl-tRNA deacylase [Thermanaeromonas toyohensis]SMB98844.1 D-tyrosyl-tRNA(Tyr) deacylase [Thermanaeromonas toyohensis ToBE]